MKPPLLCTIALCASTAIAGQRAVTEHGDVVILNDDGTWAYQDAAAATTQEIPVNPATFTKGPASVFPLKSAKNNGQYWIDPKRWSFKKGDGTNQIEYEFELKNGDLYGMAITEAIEVEVENLAAIAFENARAAAPDARVLTKEYRTVNGIKVIYMTFAGTVQGIRLEYRGYYYSDASGSTQFVTYTGQNLADTYAADIEAFLNGLSARP